MKDCDNCIHMCHYESLWYNPLQNGRKMCNVKHRIVYDIVIGDFVSTCLVPCSIMKRLPFCKFEKFNMSSNVNQLLSAIGS